MGDLNVDPINSEVLTLATEAEDIVDVIKERLGQDIDPPPTFKREGPFEGMTGKGCTRLDSVFANKAANHMVDQATYCWDLNFDDHVPIAVILHPSNLDTFTMQPIMPSRIPLEAIKKDKVTDEVHRKALALALKAYAHHIDEAIASEHLNDAHILWSDMAQCYLEQIAIANHKHIKPASPSLQPVLPKAYTKSADDIGAMGDPAAAHHNSSPSVSLHKLAK